MIEANLPALVKGRVCNKKLSKYDRCTNNLYEKITLFDEEGDFYLYKCIGCNRIYTFDKIVIGLPTRIKKIMALGGQCVDCGSDDLRIIELHHIKEEIELNHTTDGVVTPLCPNCHGLRHYHLELIK